MRSYSRAFILIFILCASSLVCGAETLEQSFANPPPETKPFCYWYWFKDDITADGITRDLEGMAKIGIGTAFIGNIYLGTFPAGLVKVFSDAWWGLMVHAIREGKRLGVDIGMFNSPGWSQSGGPWITPQRAMRALRSNETVVEGPRHVELSIPAPGPDAQDVAWLAFPRPAGESETSLLPTSIDCVPTVKNAEALIDAKPDTICRLPEGDKGLTITCTFPTAVLVRSIEMTPEAGNFRLMGEVQCSDDGTTWRTVRAVDIRQGHQGPLAGASTAAALPATKAAHWRLHATHIESNQKGLPLRSLSWSSRTVLDDSNRKQLGVVHPTPIPLWDAYRFPAPVVEVPPTETIDPEKTINLSDKIGKDGKLRWEVPAGSWVILRTAMVPTGAVCSPASPEGTGPECDKMSREHISFHVDQMIDPLYARIPAADRTALKWLIADSYEQGPQNWTDGCAADFQRRYGYDPLPWLVTLSNRVVGTPERSDRFLWDLRRMIADRIAHDYVGGLRDAAHTKGLKVWLENYGHWGFPSETLAYGGQSDAIGGEFWWPGGELGSVECRIAASAAHIYGKRNVYAEAFTTGNVFQAHPGNMKARGDWAFCEGINHFVYHVVVHQPRLTPNLGQRVWFGTEFDYLNTWHPHAKAFVDYHRRCHLMLQQGQPVADILYFTGEDAPLMTGSHKPVCPKGFDFDDINAEVLLERLTVRDHLFVLPEGQSYKVLVLPPSQTMRPATLTRIRDLVRAGGTVLGEPPQRSPSLQNWPQADTQLNILVKELWGDGNEIVRHVGEGYVICDKKFDHVFASDHGVFDLDTGKEPLLWKHRRDGDTDIYFLSNQKAATVTTDCTFRSRGSHIELWNAVDGTIQTANGSKHVGGYHTIVSLTLPANSSIFVVFRSSPSASAVVASLHDEITHALSGNWTVQFDPVYGGPASPVLFTSLTDWTTHSDPRIVTYSGTAVYRQTITINSLNPGRHVIDLGNVHDLATVTLNGQVLGTVWTPPFQIDTRDALHSGENSVEIAVANTWNNHSLADKSVDKKNKAKAKLLPAGLIGPVVVR